MGMLTIEKFLNYKKIKDITHLITEKQFFEIEKLFIFYNTETIKNRLTNIRHFILNKVDEKWLGRLYIIKNRLKNDVLSEYSCKVRYGNNWEIKQNEIKEKVKMDKEKFISLYGLTEGIKRWKERNEKTISYGLDPAVKRYGEVEGKKRWELTLKKKINTMSERKKIKPYRNGRTLSEHQERYGLYEGYNIWKKKNDKVSYRFSKQYYIDTYGDMGKEMWEKYCLNMVKTTKNSFIERYGKEEGIRRYDLFINQIKFKSSKEYYISKWGQIEGLVKYQELINKKINNFIEKYSKISQKLFWSLYEKIDDCGKCYFYELNNEYTFYVWKDDLKIINVDFKMGNKIIEFDGDYWHSNEQQKIIDKKRDQYLCSKGYKVLRVKESDFRKNSGEVIEKCLNFIKS